MNASFTSTSIQDQIAILSIMHAPANTLSSDCIKELIGKFRSLAENEMIQAIIVTGTGRFFAAGADIKEFVPALGNEEAGRSLSEAGQFLCNYVEGIQKPVIAAINGPALGGGLELALGCHYRIASDQAIVGLPELKLGLIPSFGGTQRLSRIIGKSQAIDMILSGRHLSAHEALSLGIIQKTISAENLLQESIRQAKDFTEGKSSQSISRALECIHKGFDEDIDTGLKREKNLFAELFMTADAKEGITAFIEKRSPQFKNA